VPKNLLKIYYAIKFRCQSLQLFNTQKSRSESERDFFM
jgi:hypothetical protein